MREHTNLCAEGTNVSKAAERVGGDKAGTRGEVSIGWVGLEGGVGDEFILCYCQARFHNLFRGTDLKLTAMSFVPISWPTLRRSPFRGTPRRKAMG